MRRTRQTRPFRRHNPSPEEIDPLEGLDTSKLGKGLPPVEGEEIVVEQEGSMSLGSAPIEDVQETFEWEDSRTEGSRTDEEMAADESARGDKEQKIKSQVSSQESSPAPRSFKEVECPDPPARLLKRLEWQAFYYPRRVPKRSLPAFVNYWPYINLKERTLPLPNVIEYIRASGTQSLVLSKKDGTPITVGAIPTDDTTKMLDDAFLAFSNTIIILGRQNGMTQVIVPGKSTTSYADKKTKKVKNYVWTPSVEFETINYSSLTDINALLTESPGSRSELGISQEPDLGYLPSQNVIRGILPTRDGWKDGGWTRDDRIYAFNPFLCPSIMVADDYVRKVWQRKAGKIQKRMGYTILFYSVVEKKGNVLNLRYLGKKVPQEHKTSTQYAAYYDEAVRKLTEEATPNPRQLPDRGRRRRRKVRLMPREF